MDVDISCVDEITAILYYDHLITFSEELRYIWKRSFSMASAWFLVNRYIPFLGNVVVLVVRFDSFGNEVRTPLRRDLNRCSCIPCASMRYYRSEVSSALRRVNRDVEMIAAAK